MDHAGRRSRVCFYDGQLLTARDLRDDLANEIALQPLHIRSLHRAGSVAEGLRVRLRTPRMVEVGPGLAYDCSGVALVLARPVTLGLPVTRMGQAVLVMRAQHQAACSDGHHRPQLMWREPDEVRYGEDVPLARLITPLTDPVVWPIAQPARPPQRAHGTQPVVLTNQNLDFDATLARISVVVDTRAAMFRTTPCYFAQIDLPQPGPVFELIDNPLPGRFTYQLLTGAIGWLLRSLTNRSPSDTSLEWPPDQIEQHLQLWLQNGQAFRFSMPPLVWTGVEPADHVAHGGIS